MPYRVVYEFSDTNDTRKNMCGKTITQVTPLQMTMVLYVHAFATCLLMRIRPASSGQSQRRGHAAALGHGDVVERRRRREPPRALEELAALSGARRRRARPDELRCTCTTTTAAAAAAAAAGRAAAHGRRGGGREPARRVDPFPVHVAGLGRPAEAAAGPLQVRHRLLLAQQGAQLLLLLRHGNHHFQVNYSEFL